MNFASKKKSCELSVAILFNSYLGERIYTCTKVAKTLIFISREAHRETIARGIEQFL